MQTTLKSAVTFEGVGLHTGRQTRMVVHPASAEYGIWFRRTDVLGRDTLVPARWDAVTPSELCTKITNSDGVSVSTIEHIMAALAGTGVRNALIEIDGPEVPILDGSAAGFVSGILARGLQVQHAPVRALEILERVEARNGEAYARLDHPALRHQTLARGGRKKMDLHLGGDHLNPIAQRCQGRVPAGTVPHRKRQARMSQTLLLAGCGPDRGKDGAPARRQRAKRGPKRAHQALRSKAFVHPAGLGIWQWHLVRGHGQHRVRGISVQIAPF